MPSLLLRLSMEPPFRILVKMLIGRFRVSVTTREKWGLSKRPAYLTGLLYAARRAQYEAIPEIVAIEFGVAEGRGLLVLQEEAQAIEREVGIKIKVVGFDAGVGLPEMIGDYRDHPDYWKSGDFPLDESFLRSKLSSRTRLILGDVKNTVPEFVERIQDAPIGFISFDLDLYSSTLHALTILNHPQKSMLKKVPLYFDDVMEPMVSHRFAGELLAIDEFNAQNTTVKIDQWRGIKADRPFPELPYLDCMYLAHDLKAISASTLERSIRRLWSEISS